jgi:hypothetical protein
MDWEDLRYPGKRARADGRIPIPPRPLRLRGSCPVGHVVRAWVPFRDGNPEAGFMVLCEQCGAYVLPKWIEGHTRMGDITWTPLH